MVVRFLFLSSFFRDGRRTNTEAQAARTPPAPLAGRASHSDYVKKERKKTDNPREGWENGTPPPHRDFKERGVVR